MANEYSGAGGAGPLEVRTFDLATDLFGIDIIEVSNGTLAVGASPNIARITIGGGGGGGTVTSVGLTETGSALVITGSPVTGAGTINIAGAGTNSQVILGDLTLATLPTGTIAGTIAATQVAYGTGADTIGGDAGMTWTSTPGSKKLTLLDTGAGTLFELKSSDAGGGSAPDMVMVRDSATPVAGDDIGVIVFKGNNDAPAEHEFARISAEMNTVTAGAEDGQLDFRVFVGGSIGQQMRVYEGGVYVNIANDATTDFRVDTNGTTDAFKVDAGSNTAEFNVALTSNQNITVGDGSDSDIGMIIDSNTTDYYVGRDAATDSFMIGTGTTIGSNSFFTSTTGGAVTMGTSTTTVVGNATLTSGAAGTVVVGGTGTISTTDGGISAGGTGLVTGGTVPGGISSSGHVIWRAEIPVAAGAPIDPALGSHFIVDGPAPCALQPPVIPGETITIWNLNAGGVASLDLAAAPIVNLPGAAGLSLDDAFSSIQLYNSVTAGGWVIVADSGRITPA